MVGEIMDNILDEYNKLEYKASLPDDNIRWLKTIVSFSNTAGGKLVIGVEDETKKVIGVVGSRSKIENKIADIIYNSIEPTPVIDITFKNIEDKDILIVQVSRGNETPYYIKSQGIYEGTYVRFESTDRIATQSQVDELKLTSKRLSFSSSIYNTNNSSHPLSKEELSDFLVQINQKNINKKINLNKLIEWELVVKRFDKNYATNGYMLLTSNPFSDAYIKLGLFQTKNKAKLMNEEIFTGSIIEQYENAVERTKEILNIGFNFQNVRRKEYEMPEVVIREIIANAVIHRNYNEKHPIRIEIFSDRFSIFSPGSLYDGLQLKDIMSGISKLRNKNIAEIFYSFGYIEKWGSGIQRSNQVLLEKNMRQLEIDTESIHGVTVTVYFENIKSDNIIQEVSIPSSNEVVDYYIQQNNEFKRRDLERDFNVTKRQARTIIETMLEEKLVEKLGSGPSTYYSIIKSR